MNIHEIIQELLKEPNQMIEIERLSVSKERGDKVLLRITTKDVFGFEKTKHIIVKKGASI